MSHLSVGREDVLASLLEFAANNDVNGFKRWAERDALRVDEPGLWYGRQKGPNQMVLDHRTPLMVAATYGSIDVVKLILSLTQVNVNQSCGLDKFTALHCAASGGSVTAIQVVKMLLAAGADPNLTDAFGHRPVDVIVVPPPNFQGIKLSLEQLLATDVSLGHDQHNLRVSPATPGMLFVPENQEYPLHPSLPDIRNDIYSTDEFRMFSFKVQPCSRAYAHAWTDCPFAHPGENARRRDPRKYHYSCVPCADFRKGACRKGDMCAYGHGVFECWLHPRQYRTRICKDGTGCSRRVCFFAHTLQELRPLYVSTGSAVPSPRSGSGTSNIPSAMDYATAMNFLPGFSSSVSPMPPSPFTPPIFLASNISNMGWNQSNVLALHLPGSNLESSGRLKSSLSARDIGVQQQLLDEFSCLSQPYNSSNYLNRSACSKSLEPSNLQDLFSGESSSTGQSGKALASAAFSIEHKSAVPIQFQQLSANNTSFPSKNADHPCFQTSFGVPSYGMMMSPQSMESISPMSSRASEFVQRQQQHLLSRSSRDLSSSSTSVVGSPMHTWSNLASSSGKPDWAVSPELGGHKTSSPLELPDDEEEHELSWVNKFLIEDILESTEEEDLFITAVPRAAASSSGDTNLITQTDEFDITALNPLLDELS